MSSLWLKKGLMPQKSGRELHTHIIMFISYYDAPMFLPQTVIFFPSKESTVEHQSIEKSCLLPPFELLFPLLTCIALPSKT